MRRTTRDHRGLGRGRPGRGWTFLAGLLALGLPGGAWAFCGTYVGGADAQITNHVSEVIYARFDGRTTLTLHADASGDVEDFAMLVPVPEVLTEADLNVVDPSVLDVLDGYTRPVRVQYDCSDFESDTDTDSDSDSDTDTDWDVDVEGEYIVGEYSVVLLQSGDSEELQGWLNSHGYVTPPDEQGILQDYIDQGQYFLAARLNDGESLPVDGRLSPLQLRYTSDAQVLPIRIGTLNADGTQDLIVYALNPYSDGFMGVSNATRAYTETDCMWQAPDGGALTDAQFSEFYANQLDALYAEQGMFWLLEYGWGSAKCDPCPPEMPGPAEFVTAGVPPEYIADVWALDVYVSRLHLRYAPEEVTQDLMLYASGFGNQHNQRYIDYNPQLEWAFPTCGEPTPADPGDCGFGDSGAPDDTADPTGDPTEPEGRGCGDRKSAALLGLGLLGLGRARLWRRRRGA